MMKIKFYAYSVDNVKGITTSWNECLSIVKGKKSRYRKFPSKELATLWLDNNFIIPLQQGIYFDAGTGAGEGTEIRVTNSKGEVLLKKDLLNVRNNISLKGKTNNFGELKALDYAIDIAEERNMKKIFGDSRLVIDYWSKGMIKRTLPKETVELALKVTKKRSVFEKKGGTIEHISGDINPADLGYH